MKKFDEFFDQVLFYDVIRSVVDSFFDDIVFLDEESARGFGIRHKSFNLVHFNRSNEF